VPVRQRLLGDPAAGQRRVQRRGQALGVEERVRDALGVAVLEDDGGGAVLVLGLVARRQGAEALAGHAHVVEEPDDHAVADRDVGERTSAGVVTTMPRLPSPVGSSMRAPSTMDNSDAVT
jgi:hypothetical protein